MDQKAVNCIKELAQPLIGERKKDKNELCRTYINLLSKWESQNDKIERSIWEMISNYEVSNIDSAKRFFDLSKSNSKHFRLISLMHWLEGKESEKKSDSNPRNILFDCIRHGKYDDMFREMSKLIEPWKVPAFSGAFYMKSYKKWKYFADTTSNNGSLPQIEMDIIKLLSGNEELLNYYCHSFYDKAWASVYSFLCDLLLGNERSCLKLTSMPTPTDTLQIATMCLLNNGVNGIVSDDRIPLRLRVHVAYVFSIQHSIVLESYAEEMARHKLVGLSFLYASFMEQSQAIEIVSRVIAGLPSPEETPLQAIKKLQLPVVSIVDKAIEKLINSNTNDYSEDLNSDELIDKKISALGWLELIDSDNILTESRVRGLTENFLKNEQFSACIRLLEKRGRSISDEKERLSWKVLIESQLAFDSWKHDMASIKGAETKLFEVLGFKGGWMKGCTKPTRKLIQMSIERVAIQLMEIYDSQGMHNRSLSVAAMICHPAKGLLNWFESNDLMNIILRIKQSAVLSYRQNENIQ